MKHSLIAAFLVFAIGFSTVQAQDLLSDALIVCSIDEQTLKDAAEDFQAQVVRVVKSKSAKSRYRKLIEKRYKNTLAMLELAQKQDDCSDERKVLLKQIHTDLTNALNK